MQKNTKVLLLIMVFIILALFVTVIGVKRFRNSRANMQPISSKDNNTESEASVSNVKIDNSIIQIMSGEQSISDDEIAFVHYPQLVGESEDIKKANEIIKSVYLDEYTSEHDVANPSELGFTYGKYKGILSFEMERKVHGAKEYTIFGFHQDTLSHCSNEEILTALDLQEEALVNRYNQLLHLFSEEGYQYELEKGTLAEKGIQSKEAYAEKLEQNAKITSLLGEDKPLFVSDDGELFTVVEFSFDTNNANMQYFTKFLQINDMLE